MKPPRYRQRGVALVGAIFLLVVLASLGAYMVSLTGVQETAATKSLLAARAYFGARAGIEWAVHRALHNTVAMCSSVAPVQTAFTPAGTGLTDIQVAVTCSYHSQYDGGEHEVYYITSTATHSSTGNVDHVERSLEVTISNL